MTKEGTGTGEYTPLRFAVPPLAIRERSRTSARLRINDLDGATLPERRSETAVIRTVERVWNVARVWRAAFVVGTDDARQLVALWCAVGFARRTAAAVVADGPLKQVSKIVAHGHLAEESHRSVRRASLGCFRSEILHPKTGGQIARDYERGSLFGWNRGETDLTEKAG